MATPHFKFGRDTSERRRYFGQRADADQCPPRGIPRPLMLDSERIRRVALVADLFGLDVPTVAGIFWYIDGTIDGQALGALEVGKALRTVPS